MEEENYKGLEVEEGGGGAFEKLLLPGGDFHMQLFGRG